MGRGYSHIPLVGSPGHWANPYTRNVWMHLQERATNTTEWDTAMQTGGGIFHDSSGVNINQREVRPVPLPAAPTAVAAVLDADHDSQVWCKVCSLFPNLVNESGDRSTDLNMLAPGINKRHDDLDTNGRLPEPAPKQRNGQWQKHFGFKSQLMVRHETTKHETMPACGLP